FRSLRSSSSAGGRAGPPPPPPPTAGALATAHLPAPAEDLGPALGTVRAPTLVLWGRHDPFAGPDYAAALADALPRGDLAVIGRTSHHPQAERPATVAALADAFLTDRS
ncbi:alpha/beta hydrolase, partial [Streptomyces viridosporus]|uniref:alpha/beta fold hydrolase n=1 Tax=Streptomyces viridosporus TaxID=67581 RepID=UPI003323BCD1